MRAKCRLSLRSQLTDHRGRLLRGLMQAVQFVQRKISRLETEFATQVDHGKLARLCSIPGVDLITGCTLLAELGSDMSVFNSPHHAASWAGLCPGNHESGGKRPSKPTRKGNQWPRPALSQAAWAGTRKKNSYHPSC